MKSAIITTILLIALIVLNPSMQRHKNAITEKCKELNPITGAVGGCNLYSSLGCQYHNYFLFSLTTESMNGEIVSIGLAGLPLVVKNLNI